jgi:enamine deaminase RidA (YjgF/YER057c/UK114 family)
MGFRSTSLVLMCVTYFAAVARADLVREVRPDEATHTSAAVVVDASAPLLHTPQLLPTGADGLTIVAGGAAEQANALLDRLESALKAAGSGLDKLVKVDVYLARPDVLAPFQKMFAAKLKGLAQPAISYVVGPLRHPEALVALDAIAITSISSGKAGGGSTVLPSGPRIFVAGQANPDTDLTRATRKTLESLDDTLKFLGLDRSRVVRLKAFMQPMTSDAVAQVERTVSDFFGGIDVPPLSVVAWQSTRETPIEIEMVAAGKGPNGPAIEYLTPPFLKVSPLYSRIARVGVAPLIYVSGLYGTSQATGAAEVESIFETLGGILADAGCDMRHLAKATYYVSNDAVSRALNEIRPRFYDSKRPPAASKAFVAGVGDPGRAIVIDMVGVGIGR